MGDLILMEFLIGGILFLSLIRPFVKAFQGVDGLALLPSIAVIPAIALFPAYGLRPETLPLVFFAIVRFFWGLPHLFRVLRGRRTEDYGEHHFLPAAVGVLLLVLACGFAIRYTPTPEVENRLPFAARGVRDYSRGVNLHLRAYGGPGGVETDKVSTKTMVLLLPPPSGSVEAVHGVSEALAESGFPVLTYSREGLDIPAFRTDGGRAYPLAGDIVRHAGAFIAGTRYQTANEWGRLFEEERLADLVFLLRYLRRETPEDTRFLVVAYGAAGAAAVRYAAEAPANIAGVVAVEGPIVSSLVPEGPRRQETGSGMLGRWMGAAKALGPTRMVGVGEVPIPGVPVLFLLSDRIRETGERDGRYASIIRVLRSARVPILLVALEGAGLFDYSDIPELYPVYSAIGKGSILGPGTPSDRAGFLSDTTGLIRNFAALVEKSAQGEALGVKPNLTTIQSSAHVEAAGPWNSSVATDILGR